MGSAGYKNSINQLSDSIQLASKEVEREKKARDDDLGSQDDVIKDERKHGDTMRDNREAAASAKVDEEARLVALKEAHETNEETLTKTVMESRQELAKMNNKHTTNYEAERSVYAADLANKKKAHEKEINEIDAEIAKLTVTQTEVKG